MRKLFNNPIVLLFFALAFLSGCSRSKSDGDDSRANEQRERARAGSPFDVNYNNGRANNNNGQAGIPNRATWTAEQTRCVEFARTQGRPMEMCFNDFNNQNTNRGQPPHQASAGSPPPWVTPRQGCVPGESRATHRDHLRKKRPNLDSGNAPEVIITSVDTPREYPVYVPAPEPEGVYVPAPERVQRDPEPERVQPAPRRPAVPSSPPPAPQQQVPAAVPSQAPVAAVPVAPAVQRPAPIQRQAPPAVVVSSQKADAVTASAPKITRPLYVVFQNLEGDVSPSQELLNAANSAFSNLALFKKQTPAKIIADGSYNIVEISSEQQPIISEKLAFFLMASYDHNACDVNGVGPCVIFEKDLGTKTKYAAYFLAADFTKIKLNAKTPKENGIVYYRKDLRPTERALAERALSDSKDGFYLFSQLKRAEPAAVVQVAPPPTVGVVAQPQQQAAPRASAPVEIEQRMRDVQREADQLIEKDIKKCLSQQEYEAKAHAGGNNQARLNGTYQNKNRRDCTDPRLKVEQQKRQLDSAHGTKGVYYFCALKATFEANTQFIGAVVGQKKSGTGNIYCKPSDGGPTQNLEIAFEEDQGLSLGVDLGTSTHSLVATGFGWANGADDLITIQEYHYPAQANVTLSFLGGLGITPIIFGANNEQNVGPVFAFAASGTSPSIFKILRLTLRLNLGGKWTLGIKG